jgi:cysteinyl-tRNA synthetase
VTYVRNITDIEDKIIKRALERGITIRALTDEMIAAMHDDLAASARCRPRTSRAPPTTCRRCWR